MSEMPDGLLRMSWKTWSRLGRDVRRLVVQLAHEQSFKCAHCDRRNKLIIEHDHFPEHGRGDKYTIYNIRGLACQRCNWHIGMYEADQRGDSRGWDDAYIYITESHYYPYVQRYESRVYPLLEAMLEAHLGSRNYWRRRRALQKLDDWKDWAGKNPHRVQAAELRTRRRCRIRTPEQFFKTLSACMRFVLTEKKRDPSFEPPDSFFEILAKVKPLLDHIEHLTESKANSYTCAPRL